MKNNILCTFVTNDGFCSTLAELSINYTLLLSVGEGFYICNPVNGIYTEYSIRKIEKHIIENQLTLTYYCHEIQV